MGLNTDSITMQLGRIGPWLVIAILAAVGFSSTMPPSQTATDSATEFDVDRAFRHVGAIAGEPHPMGSDAIRTVRGYIVAELRALDIEPDLQAATAPDFFGRGDSVEIVNIIARIPGATGAGTIALVGHYDTVPTTPAPMTTPLLLRLFWRLREPSLRARRFRTTCC